jgi:hypothetical protein
MSLLTSRCFRGHVELHVWYNVQATARLDIHLQFDINAYVLQNKSGAKCKVYSHMCCWLYLLRNLITCCPN